MKKIVIMVCCAMTIVIVNAQLNPTSTWSIPSSSGITYNSGILHADVANPNVGDTTFSYWVGPGISDTVVRPYGLWPNQSILVTGLPDYTTNTGQVCTKSVQYGLIGCTSMGSFMTLHIPTYTQITFLSPILTPTSMKIRFHYETGSSRTFQLYYGYPTPTIPLPGTLTLNGVGDTAFTINSLLPLQGMCYEIHATSVSPPVAYTSATQCSTTPSIAAPLNSCSTANINSCSADIVFSTSPGDAYAGSTVTKVYCQYSYGATTLLDSMIGSWNTLYTDTFHRSLPFNTLVTATLTFVNAAGVTSTCVQQFTTADENDPDITISTVYQGNTTELFVGFSGAGNGHETEVTVKTYLAGTSTLVSAFTIQVGSCAFSDTVLVASLPECLPFDIQVIAQNILGIASDIYENANTGCIGIEQQSMVDLNVYPNPASNFITIAGIEQVQNPMIRFIGLDGKIIFMQLSGNQVSVDALASGMYSIQVFNADNVPVYTGKVMIVH